MSGGYALCLVAGILMLIGGIIAKVLHSSHGVARAVLKHAITPIAGCRGGSVVRIAGKVVAAEGQILQTPFDRSEAVWMLVELGETFSTKGTNQSGLDVKARGCKSVPFMVDDSSGECAVVHAEGARTDAFPLPHPRMVTTTADDARRYVLSIGGDAGWIRSDSVTVREWAIAPGATIDVLGFAERTSTAPQRLAVGRIKNPPMLLSPDHPGRAREATLGRLVLGIFGCISGLLVLIGLLFAILMPGWKW